MKKFVLFLGLISFVLVSTLTNAQTVNVTFKVDMQEQTVSPNGVHVAGSFQGWNPGLTPMVLLVDDIYTYTFTGTAGQYIEYKFINGNSWTYPEPEEVYGPCAASGGTNRYLTFPDNDTILPAYCFGECLPCVLPPVDVTFQVDMANETVSGTGVFLVGGFNGWDTDSTEMINTVDDIYSATVTLGEGEYHQYKFYNGDYEPNLPLPCGTGGAYSNRWIDVPSADSTLALVCYGSCDTCTSVTDINVTFKVDMSELDSISVDGVHIAGTFQGWDPGTTLMTNTGGDIYEFTTILQSGSYHEWKFVNGTAWGAEEVVPFYCEQNSSRHKIMPNKNLILEEVCFGRCMACTLDPVDITFTVDMTEQYVSTEGVHITGSSLNWVVDSVPMIDQGDGIYQVTLSINDELMEYKFINGNEFAGAEFVPFECNYNDNRYLIHPGADKTLDTVCFSRCDACINRLYIFDLKVFLEGSFNVLNMKTTLNDNGQVPNEQPFNEAPWNYDGTETNTAPPETNIVDWVYLVFRETDGVASTATPDKFLDHQAALLLADGSIVSTDGSTPVLYTGNITQNLYVLIYHRNHLGIMSSIPMVETKGAFNYDFTNGIGKAYGDGQKALSGGMYGMIGGDSNANGTVDLNDKDVNWKNDAGLGGYYQSDLNMDTQVNNRDKNVIWEPNLDEGTQIPQ